MNLVKIGKMLQTLRKEKGMTQEQLAEKLGVARGTVSRWETGSNMSDLNMLIELSDFYAIDLREILSGERKSEQMNEEMKETVLQVAEYGNEDKARLLRRMYWLSIAGLIGFGMFLVTTLLDLSEVSPYEEIGSFGLGLAFGMMVLWVIYTSRYMAKIKQFKKKLLNRATESD
ncbi:helix-turn-helix domain-containing protein [Floccifex porci]|uniref:Helix-turn-helix domain-containing protein n=1 Tax=Floccifex porci TaxID=2606629 RepID=A0A7X2N4J1_9FIRM|nr:helix-turn-helix domain-containing protein [Floccifex porci]MSS02352.1 helix-turn-helix domain-containing protein [Floccifex porci]